MHAITAAEVPPFTLHAWAPAFPFQIPHHAVAVLPYVLEAVLTDVTLDELSREVWAGPDVTITKNTRNVDARGAIK